MKCPKCGYLGFETTDRCRNCGYDFSLSPFTPAAELPLQQQDAEPDPTADFDLPPIRQPADALNPASLDLDRLFGEAEAPAEPSPVLDAPPAAAPRRAAAPLKPATLTPAGLDPKPEAVRAVPHPAPPVVPAPVASAQASVKPAMKAAPVAAVVTPPPEALPVAPPPVAAVPPEVAMPPAGAPGKPETTDQGSALPFDDMPLINAPRPARAPLAVRRATPEFPRGRSRTTTRPVKPDTPLPLRLDESAASGTPAPDASPALSMEPAPIGRRLPASLIDLALLVGISAGVLFLTLRIAGLETTMADIGVIPRVPFIAFVGVLALGYLAGFTVAGGQTIGKMIMKIRVIGDDGRSVDAAGGVLRALGSLLVPLTAGLSYIPVFITAERRALHDRLSGTRVVSE